MRRSRIVLLRDHRPTEGLSVSSLNTLPSRRIPDSCRKPLGRLRLAALSVASSASVFGTVGVRGSLQRGIGQQRIRRSIFSRGIQACQGSVQAAMIVVSLSCFIPGAGKLTCKMSIIGRFKSKGRRDVGKNKFRRWLKENLSYYYGCMRKLWPCRRIRLRLNGPCASKLSWRYEWEYFSVEREVGAFVLGKPGDPHDLCRVCLALYYYVV